MSSSARVALKAILLVEDNEDDVFFTERTLKAAQCENPLLVVRDGQEAVDYLNGLGPFADRERFPFPALILLDIKLPYRSGLEVLGWIRQQTQFPPTFIVVLTGSNEPRDLQKAYDLGCNTYFVKPPDPEMFFEIVRRFDLDWLRCKALPKTD